MDHWAFIRTLFLNYLAFAWIVSGLFFLFNKRYFVKRGRVLTDHQNEEHRLEMRYGHITPRQYEYMRESYRYGYRSYLLAFFLFAPFTGVPFYLLQLLLLSEHIPEEILDEVCRKEEARLKKKREAYEKELEADLEERKTALVHSRADRVKFVW